MANTKTSNQAVTADTITDETIRELRDEVFAGRITLGRDGLDYEIIVATNKALGGARKSTRAEGRARCAEIFNARRHVLTCETSDSPNADNRYRSTCSCGWQGSWVASKANAWRDAKSHSPYAKAV